MALWDLFLNNRGREVRKWTQYFPAYERHFQQFVGKPLVFLEIGCGRGGSLQMWKKYFGPRAVIIGIDIKPKCKKYEEEQIHVRIGSQSDVQFLTDIIEEFGIPDIVLDDGSHRMSDIMTSFNTLYSKVDHRGVYLVEDLHTAYWEEYEGGVRREGSFIEKCKHLIDELNADHTRGELEPTDFTRNTLSMHFYDSIVVFEKGMSGEKNNLKIGKSIQF